MKIMDHAEMKIDRAEIGLGRRQTLRISNGAGYTIACRHGQLWITQEGQSRDFILGPMESFVIYRPGDVLVQGYRDARIMVAAPHRKPRIAKTILEKALDAIAHFSRRSDRLAGKVRHAASS